MKHKRLRSIRIDDIHTIKLMVSRWFPSMVVLTFVLAIAGTFFYGNILSTSSSFSAGVIPLEEKVQEQTVVTKEPKKNPVVPVVALRKDVTPRIIGAETKLPNIKLELESTSVVGDSAMVTYRIYNTGSTVISGSTWAVGENPNRPLNKRILPWKARTFTRKTASFPLSSTSPGEFKIFVSDDVAKVANSYTVRF